MGWIQVRNFCLDSDPELGKFKAGSGSTTLLICLTVNMQHFWRVMINNIPASASRGALIFASLVKNFKIVSKPTGIRLVSVRRTSRGEECYCYLSPVVEVSVPLQCLQNINGSDIVDSKKANGYCWALAMFFSSRKSEIVPTSLSKGLKYYICTGSC